ncbi:MAG TPA: Coenzyme F420 hydrogenase/dehydrogenase, beta subunit C-terminal domain [Bacteroidales bacterium]|nr:Coenzyme F420 hydrogenase/dehydrogenase, beta subunit C-terminal domain [Bacteroidales bacterium]HOR82411.1 Coenzyme F420 hydrogenase/dehydrogenase, beta subunit C-terminal domain [Bacteroidales bacterium]HPJ91604.1 Coenzyme F420 hydrogenase/dehydrogenase, beta subunit C-terminal domain [Bacteroidales bacterium]
MKNNKINILNSVIEQNLCVGCGACLYDISKSKMSWNNEGFLIPTAENLEDLKGEQLIKVCPFNTFPDDKVKTENELTEIFLQDAPNFHHKAGKYFSTYAGFSEQFRLTSSSGGIATFLLSELFEQKLIDAVITVGEGENEHYEYKLIKNKDELLSTSKTKYYPVSLAETLQKLKDFDGKVAVVGIGCFIKSIRLLQYYYPELQKKIVFTIGIICGGLKSKFFAEYLAGKAGIKNNVFSKPQFRIKDHKSTAGDYSFGCLDKFGTKKQIKMRTIGDMWGTGMFKCNACDFCDDVTTELADISLGDAWLQPYNLDGKGTNVIISRSILAEKIIKMGTEKRSIQVEKLPIERFLVSQQGSFNHRHKGLKYRIKKAKNKNQLIPPKRHDNENITLYFKWVQKQRMKVRKRSLKVWSKKKNTQHFDKKMFYLLFMLKNQTRLYHLLKKFKI